MSTRREWMYARLDENGLVSSEFYQHLDTFISFALSKKEFLDGDNIRCPCMKCRNRKFESEETVRFHLLRNGFVSNYYTWVCQGEGSTFQTSSAHESTFSNAPHEVRNSFRQLVVDAAGVDFDTQSMKEKPNPKARKFYDLLGAADSELYPGCKRHTLLSFVARLLNIKSKYQFSEQCYDELVEVIKEAIPDENNFPDNFYRTKRLVQSLGLPSEKIDCCKSGCMLYWGVDINLVRCKFCDRLRFKHQRSSASNHNISYSQMHYFPLSPRLKRLYASTATASHMRWHAEHEQIEDVMSHPYDSLSWLHFNAVHPTFSSESRNVRLGLCTDDFQPFGQSGEQYSSWPIMVTPYNLPPWMCMKEAYMFLTVEGS